MLQFDLTQHRCECNGHVYRWSEPRLDQRRGKYRFNLVEAIKPCEARLQAELSIDMNDFDEETVRAMVAAKVLFFEAHRMKAKQSLADYIFQKEKWEDIRTFFYWSIDTSSEYRGILKNHFDAILNLPISDITTADIDRCIEDRVSSSSINYKASTLQSWLKVINRIFVYLCAVYPDQIRNPVRFNGRKIRESRVDEKQRIKHRRLSQSSLYDSQEKRLLFAFLEDLKAGDTLSVAGITMLESGRRPIEAGAISPQLCYRPDGEDFFTIPVRETDAKGNISKEYKNGRANRLLPNSPVLSAVFDFVAARTKNADLPETIPYAAKLSYSTDGALKNAKGFSPAQISRYVHSKILECGIDMTVYVEDSDQDSNDNRRAYLLRYSFETDLISFLALDRTQYVLGHKRVTSRQDVERKPADYYMAPQVQREIYLAMAARDYAVYGKNIIEEIKAFLYSDER